jgi:hypothetical protein
MTVAKKLFVEKNYSTIARTFSEIYLKCRMLTVTLTRKLAVTLRETRTQVAWLSVHTWTWPFISGTDDVMVKGQVDFSHRAEIAAGGGEAEAERTQP